MQKDNNFQLQTTEKGKLKVKKQIENRNYFFFQQNQKLI